MRLSRRLKYSLQPIVGVEQPTVLYYAVFHAVNALLINDGLYVNTHHGSHALFHLHYIKTGKMPIEYARLYSQLQTMREESDYNCVYEVEPEELKQRIKPAQQFIEDIERAVNANL